MSLPQYFSTIVNMGFISVTFPSGSVPGNYDQSDIQSHHPLIVSTTPGQHQWSQLGPIQESIAVNNVIRFDLT